MDNNLIIDVDQILDFYNIGSTQLGDNVKNPITENFVLPGGACHTDYRIIMKEDTMICVHKDYVGLILN